MGRAASESEANECERPLRVGAGLIWPGVYSRRILLRGNGFRRGWAQSGFRRERGQNKGFAKGFAKVFACDSIINFAH